MEPLTNELSGDEEVDGETRVIEFSSKEALRSYFLRDQQDGTGIRRVLGFPDPPPPPKNWKERFARFFGIDEEQAELKIWRIRHALALQGYLQPKYVPQLRDYETDEVDTVCFRWRNKTTADNREIHLNPVHSTGRSFEYRELCRPNPPAKAHTWVMFWEYLQESFGSLNIWRRNRAVQFRAFGHNVAEHFQELVEDIKSKDFSDGAALVDGEAEVDGDDADIEHLTFFDDRTLPFSREGGDVIDGPAPAFSPSHRARPMREVFAERTAARSVDRGHMNRRAIRHIEQDKPVRQSDRSKPKFGLISLVLGRRYKSGTIDTATQTRLSDVYSFRPYFTYWASTVHILVMIITLATYGFAPVGVGNKMETKSVASVTGASTVQPREIERNFWFGPTFTDLIHLGAKYGPCMRRDKRIFDEITGERARERDLTACCIKADSEICFQSTQQQCSSNFFRWLKWSGNATVDFANNVSIPVPTFSSPDLVRKAEGRTCINDGSDVQCYRTSGSLCGQDPVSCRQPASAFPREWPDDISSWPVCTAVDSILNSTASTSCEVTGRPCCIGKQGVCTMATKEHCDYVQGFYHGDKRLCSEVNCLEDICGLTSFLRKDSPDQVYRLWISLCLHVGILHLAITLFVHMTIGRHIEKLIGWFRMGMIYILSGIGGNLVSAVFVPYQAEVGPGGALFGLLATLYIEILQQWRTLETPVEELVKVTVVVVFFFILGLLPYLDNFANISGFIFGLLLAAIFVPFLQIRPNSERALSADKAPDSDHRRKKIIMIAVAAPLVVALFVVLSIVFWVVQDWSCHGCRYVNCIPLTSTLCQDLSQDIRHRDPYV